MRIQILFLFFACQLFCQTAQLDKLFNAFDRYDNDEVKKTLTSINENNIFLYSENDSIRFSLYKLIKFQSTDTEKLRKDSSAVTNYQIHLNYLISKGFDDHLPYFLNHYTTTYAFDETYYLSCLKYLNLSIEVEKKGLNKSHFLSVVNLFDALDWKDILRSVYDIDYKDEDLKSLILHYESNNKKLNFLSQSLLFKKYYKVSKSKFINKDFCFSALKKIFKYGAKLESLPVGYSYRNLLFYFRTSALTDTSALSYINKNYRDLISSLNYLINECYINNYSASSFNGLKNQINTFLDRNIVLTPDEIFDIKFLLSKFSIKIKKRWLETKPSRPDINFWHEVFNLRYKFNKLYGSSSDLLSSIDEIISLNTNYGSGKYDIDIESLELEKHDLIYDVIINNNSEGVLPDDFIGMYKIRSKRIYYPDWTENKIKEDVLSLFSTYKKTINYEDLVLTLELYWKHASNIKNYKIEGIEIDAILNETKLFIINELDAKITDQDLDLRIFMSNIEELEVLKYTVETLYSQKIINKARFKFLNLNILQRQYNIENTYESAFAYYQFIIDNIQVTGFESSITVAMGLAVEFKFNYKLVEVSNYLMKNYDEFYNNQPNINKYSFQMMSGFFYRYIKNDKRALMRFISARANPYHWSREIASYEDMTRDHLLIYEIFEIFLFDKKYEDARHYLNLYTDQYNNLVQGLKNNTSFVKLDKDMFFKIKRRSLDMKRRLLSSESKYEESELVLDEMIVLEEEKYFYGKFNLLMRKFETQMSFYKHSNPVFLNKLDSLYYEYNVEFDSQYYRNKKYLGEFSQQYFDYKLIALKSELKNINLINELSYENQINMLYDIGLKMSVIENEIHSHTIDSKQTSEVLNYKLKVDDLDRYNTILLNVSEENSDMYFKLLNKRSYEKNYDKLQLIKSEFDIFQQNIKTVLNKNEEIELQSFQNKLKSNQAYIRFSKLNKLVFVAHLITKNQTEIITISETDLTKLIDYYTSRITKNLKDIYSYNLLFKPIADKLPSTITELFIKNEGLFNNVNLEALWNPEKNKFLFDIYEINYVERPAAVFNIDITSEFESAFLFGNPNFSNGSTSLETINSKVRAGINPLPYTEKEINALNILLTAQNIKTVTTNLESSTEESLYANTKSSIIHLATHGFFVPGSKYDRFNWGLLGANSKTSLQNDFQKKIRNDGIIFGSEIILKDFTRTELVVLSACETGFGNSTFMGGENLANSFLRAGAKNIISTLWPVDDKITQEFMLLFYQELLKSNKINTSLRNAKQVIKNQYKNPNYWAPFVLLQNKIKL
jgi:CHAT domain-containing protein